jgi:predicted RNA polymerase sigma factor
METRVALTLRMVGGLTVPEIVRAFLVQEATMGQRITRAKANIRAAGIPYRVPSAEDHYFATRADLLRRLGCSQKSRAAYDKAIELAGDTAETAYLTRRRDQLR